MGENKWNLRAADALDWRREEEMAQRRKSGPVVHLASIAAASVAVLVLAAMLPANTQPEMVASVQSEPARAHVPLRPSYIVSAAPLLKPAPAEPAPARVSLSVQPVAVMVEPEPEPAEKWYVTAGALNLRSGPSSSTAQLAALPMGTAVEVAGTDGNWSEIVTADGLRGWAFTKYLSRTAPF
jgi:uncharacterized protein YgiM (DUF1202 family)